MKLNDPNVHLQLSGNCADIEVLARMLSEEIPLEFDQTKLSASLKIRASCNALALPGTYRLNLSPCGPLAQYETSDRLEYELPRDYCGDWRFLTSSYLSRDIRQCTFTTGSELMPEVRVFDFPLLHWNAQ